jgi:hypothetical protein
MRVPWRRALTLGVSGLLAAVAGLRLAEFVCP